MRVYNSLPPLLYLPRRLCHHHLQPSISRQIGSVKYTVVRWWGLLVSTFRLYPEPVELTRESFLYRRVNLGV